MMLLRAVAPGRMLDSNQLRWSSAREAASTPEESYDTASLFRGRKSRLRVDCCKTSAPPARGARRDRRWLLRTATQTARERFAPPSQAGWRFPRSAGKTGLPAFRRLRDRRRSFALPRLAGESPRPGPESAA